MGGLGLVNVVSHCMEGDVSFKGERVVYKSFVKPGILYEGEAWCWKESEMGMLQMTERSMVRAMCGLEGNNGSVGYSKQCSLVWSCVEKGISF